MTGFGSGVSGRYLPQVQPRILHRPRHAASRAAIASDKEAIVFLSTEGTRVSQKDYADAIHEAGFAPLKDLMKSLAAAGGEIYVCSPCFKKRGLDENIRLDGSQFGFEGGSICGDVFYTYAGAGLGCDFDNGLD